MKAERSVVKTAQLTAVVTVVLMDVQMAAGWVSYLVVKLVGARAGLKVSKMADSKV